MPDNKEKVFIAHALPIVLSVDGKFRILLGQKTVGNAVDDILIQPFGGKVEQGEKTMDAGIRELLEEVDGFDPEVAERFFEGVNSLKSLSFYGVFSAPSDVRPEKILVIHCWGRRLLSQIPVSEKIGSEMKNPQWYTFKEIFEHPKSGTLTKVMAACYGGIIYYDIDCIGFLQKHINHPYLPLRITILETLLTIARNQDKKMEYMIDVLQQDSGLIELIRNTFYDLDGKIPKKVIFQCGKLSRYEL